MKIFSTDNLVLTMRLDKAKRNCAEAKQYFENDIINISKILKLYYPLEVLKMAAWEERRIHSSKVDEASALYASFFPSLLQSIVQSKRYFSLPSFSANRDIKEKDWKRLKSLSNDAANRLTWYLENYAIIQVKEGVISESHYISYRDQIAKQFFPTYLNDDEYNKYTSFYESLLLNDSTKVDTFGVDNKTLLSELKKICDNGRNAIDNLSRMSREIHNEIDLKISQLKLSKPNLSNKELMNIVIRENNYSAQLDELKSQRDDFDLFQVERVSLLPSTTLKLFSQNVSTDDVDFISQGYLSATLHPFLRFANRFYCFVGRTLFSNLSICIEKISGFSGFDMQNYFNQFVAPLFYESDSVDVYTWRGNRFDISLLPTLSWFNAIEKPYIFEARIKELESEAAIGPKLGHTRLLIYPDGVKDVVKISDRTYSLSLSTLASVSKSEKAINEFYQAFSLSSSDEESILKEFDDVLESDSIQEDVYDDALFDESSSDEYEFDAEDDDLKAKELDAKFNKDINSYYESSYKEKTKEELLNLQDKYDLPENVKNADIVEELVDLDQDEADDEELYDDVDDLCSELDELDTEDYLSESEEQSDFVDDDYDDIIDEDEFDDPSFVFKKDDEDGEQLSLFDDLYPTQPNRKIFTSAVPTLADISQEDNNSNEETPLESEEPTFEENPSAEDTIPNDENQPNEESITNVEPSLDSDTPTVEETISNEETTPCDDNTPIEENTSSESDPLENEIPSFAENTQSEDSLSSEEPSLDTDIVTIEETNSNEIGLPDEETYLPDDTPAVEENTLKEENAPSEDASIESENSIVEETLSTEETPLDSDTATIEETSSNEIGLPDEETTPIEENKPCEDTPSESEKPSFEENLPYEETITNDETQPIEESIINEEPSLDSDTSTVEENSLNEVNLSDEETLATEESLSTEENITNEEALLEIDPSSIEENDLNEELSSDIDTPTVEENSSNDEKIDLLDIPNELPPLINEIKNMITGDGVDVFSRFISEVDDDTLNAFCNVVKECFDAQQSDKKDKMFTIYDYKISVIVALEKRFDALRKNELRNNVGAVMVSRDESSWTSLVLTFADNMELISANSEMLSESIFSTYDWKIVRVIGQQLKNRL